MSTLMPNTDQEEATVRVGRPASAVLVAFAPFLAVSACSQLGKTVGSRERRLPSSCVSNRNLHPAPKGDTA